MRLKTNCLYLILKCINKDKIAQISQIYMMSGLSYPTIFRYLKTLLSKKLVTCTRVINKRMQNKKHYTITLEGIKYLKENTDEVEPCPILSY